MHSPCHARHCLTAYNRLNHFFFAGSSKCTLGSSRGSYNLAEPTLGRKPVFTSTQEKALVDHLLMLDRLCHGMRPMKVRQLAYEYAEKNGIRHNFNKQRKMAGWAWYTGFMKRHTRLSNQLSEPTSLSRLIGFNRKDVELFYGNLYVVFKNDAYAAVQRQNRLGRFLTIFRFWYHSIHIFVLLLMTLMLFSAERYISKYFPNSIFGTTTSFK